MERRALVSDYETAVSCAKELNLSAEELAGISSIGAGDTNHNTIENCCKIYGDMMGTVVAVSGTAIGIAGITYAATDDCVVTVGVSANASAGFGACGSNQIAFDKNGNSEAQATAGYALSTQEKVALTGTISIYPGMKPIQ